MNIAFVLWACAIGGTERLSVSLAGEMRSRGLSTSVVFVGEEGNLREQLEYEALNYECLNLPRGRFVLRDPRALARAVEMTGADVAIVGSFGYLGAALKAGGFPGAVIGVEHGALLTMDGLPWAKRVMRRVDRLSGAISHDAEVAVSNFMLRLEAATHHARRLVCIPHGVRVPNSPKTLPALSDCLRIGYVGRLIPGKGVDVTLRALAELREKPAEVLPKLTIAGDGPDRLALETMTEELHLGDRVEFVGWIDDAPRFWQEHHISVAPASSLVESFCMTVAEAMAQGRPSIVSNRGALPELVLSDVTGSIVSAGDPSSLADGIDRYARTPELVMEHGSAAHQRAREYFTLEHCANDYLALAQSLIADK